MEKNINTKQRMDFVEFWAAYVKTHPDWSEQHAQFINAMLKNSASISKATYLKMKQNKA